MPSKKNSQGTIYLTCILVFIMMIPTSWATTTPYECPSPFSYVTTADAVDFETEICSQITDSNYYRIAGGAAINCTSGTIAVTNSYVNPLTKALCINITVPSVLSPHLVSGASCPVGESTVSVSVATAYKSTLCPTLTMWTIARIGKNGGLKGSGYGAGCVIENPIGGSIGDLICAPTMPATITMVNTDETLCPGTCKSLYTYQEALTDNSGSKTFCALISAGTTVRLAGGASMTKTGSSCSVSNSDRNSLTDGLCGAIVRAGCTTGSYMEPSTCSCQSCSNPCTACSGTATTCTACVSVTPYVYNGNCYTTCPAGYYSSNNVCTACTSPCANCAGSASTCTACVSATPFLYNSNCYTTCPAGTFQSSNTECSVCTSPCANCTGSASTCTACDTTAPFLYRQACYTQCPSGTYNSTTSTCCPLTCSACDSSSNCLTCKGDYVLEGGQCKESGGLSAGQIVGIVLGSIAVVAFIGIIAKVVISHKMVSKGSSSVISAKISPDTESAGLQENPINFRNEN